jgi:hypothetical protein
MVGEKVLERFAAAKTVGNKDWKLGQIGAVTESKIAAK